jgi:hypothetical protein
MMSGVVLFISHPFMVTPYSFPSIPLLSTTTMTFAVLRALHTIIADALDDIQRVYDPESLSGLRSPPVSAPKGDGKNSPYASPPPTPSTSTHFNPLDFPSLDVPHDPADPSELLTAHPTVVVAINRIVAAAGQMAAIVQTPFLSLCDSSMGVRNLSLGYGDSSSGFLIH